MPALCPTEAIAPRLPAQRPFPSIIMATCSGVAGLVGLEDVVDVIDETDNALPLSPTLPRPAPQYTPAAGESLAIGLHLTRVPVLTPSQGARRRLGGLVRQLRRRQVGSGRRLPEAATASAPLIPSNS